MSDPINFNVFSGHYIHSYKVMSLLLCGVLDSERKKTVVVAEKFRYDEIKSPS